MAELDVIAAACDSAWAPSTVASFRPKIVGGGGVGETAARRLMVMNSTIKALVSE